MRVLVSMFTDVAVTLGLQSTTKAWLGRRLDLDEASPSL
jgi:hypothetical protein